jgi:hypothetical protein
MLIGADIAGLDPRPSVTYKQQCMYGCSHPRGADAASACQRPALASRFCSEQCRKMYARLQGQAKKHLRVQQSRVEAGPGVEKALREKLSLLPLEPSANRFVYPPPSPHPMSPYGTPKKQPISIGMPRERKQRAQGLSPKA